VLLEILLDVHGFALIRLVSPAPLDSTTVFSLSNGILIVNIAKALPSQDLGEFIMISGS
jgi:hypothetical protein